MKKVANYGLQPFYLPRELVTLNLGKPVQFLENI
jgi:hypothetical protein